MIAFVYFDLGGVVEKDFSASNKWEDLRRELSVRPEQDDQFEKVWAKYDHEICVTRDVETLIPILRKELHLQVPQNFSLLDAFVKRFEKNESIWSVIEFVHKKCRIGILSNMYFNMLPLMEKRGILPPIAWDVVIDSSVVGYQKPQKEIFLLGEKLAEVPSQEILFVENSKMHIDAAQKLGWQTFLYDSANYEQSSRDLSEFFERNS